MNERTEVQNEFDEEIDRLAKLCLESRSLGGYTARLFSYLFDEGGGYEERSIFFPKFGNLIRERMAEILDKKS